MESLSKLTMLVVDKLTIMTSYASLLSRCSPVHSHPHTGCVYSLLIIERFHRIMTVLNIHWLKITVSEAYIVHWLLGLSQRKLSYMYMYM